MSCPDCPDFVPDSGYHLAQHIAEDHGEPGLLAMIEGEDQ